MKIPIVKSVLTVTAGMVLALGISATSSAIDKGGTLNFVVASKIPSYDGHQETTFGMVHPIRPFYSLLIRVNPENPSDPADFKCDLCEGDVPTGTDGGTKYTFKIRSGITFHDGTPLTSADIKATYDKIIFPPEGIPSSRKAFFKMVDSVEAPDASTVVFNLKFPSGSFIPAVATPFNFVYSKKDLDDHGHDWHKKNVNGTGPFIFVEDIPGQHVMGKKNPNYHFEGQPYLDGFKAISAPKMAVRINAIRGNQASIEFRGFPPKARDDMVNALGDQLTVQESDWNCVLMSTANMERPPFDDIRVRQALTLAVDRYAGSKYLSQIAIVKTVGGAVFPGHPLAASQEEMEQLIGYSRDIDASRAKARALLKEAGVPEGFQFIFNNRGVDQPYKVVGTWLVDQWRRIGLDPQQTVKPSPQFYDTLRKKGDFDVSIDFNCQSVINPIADVSKFLCSAGNNYSNCENQEIEDLYNSLIRAETLDEQRALMRQYEKAAFDLAGSAITLWWYKINPHRAYVKGWNIAPSHYLNQHLDNVWCTGGTCK